MERTVVIALGGNAILGPGQEGHLEEQMANIATTVSQISDVIAEGNRVVLTHGNGPQVGAILLQNDLALGQVPAMPLDVCGAMSQGMLGYMIQQVLSNALEERDIDLSVVSLVTQARVDPDDPAFDEPTKPIGRFHSEEHAQSRAAEAGEAWIEDAGRGWRKVVPSPEPEKIVEAQAIQTLLTRGAVVICMGGGGIPVIRSEGRYRGVEAVIDKDLGAERLAEDVGADVLLILTDIENVMLNYGTPEEEALTDVTLQEAERYLKECQFASGSMAPKVEACLRFARWGGDAIVTSLDRALDALRGEAGTRFSARS